MLSRLFYALYINVRGAVQALKEQIFARQRKLTSKGKIPSCKRPLEAKARSNPDCVARQE
jgi:hypothetical protein